MQTPFYYAAGETNFDGVPEFEYYKALRETELTAYRYALRGFVMQGGTETDDFRPSKAVQRLLEDLRENFNVNDERHAIELELALQDPTVVAVRNSRIISRRNEFPDGIDEVPITNELDADDDGGRLVSTASKRPAGKTAQKARPQPVAVPPSQPAKEVATKESAARRAVREKLEAIGAKIADVSHQLVRCQDKEAKVILRVRLSSLDEELQALASSRL
jgi:hypothetical protein